MGSPRIHKNVTFLSIYFLTNLCYTVEISNSERGDYMMYQKNKEMQYIQTDETSLSVYNPVTGDAIFFDAEGIDILNALDEPCDLESLLATLCETYDTAPDDMREHVEEFLQQATAEKVVLVL